MGIKIILLTEDWLENEIFIYHEMLKSFEKYEFHFNIRFLIFVYSSCEKE